MSMTTSVNTLVIGTRGSKLALTQANIVTALLRQAHPQLQVDIKIISTQGDRVLDVALSKIGDKGLFVKELETALLQGEVHLAVHSAKDLPSQLPAGLTLAAFLPRGDVRDALVLRDRPSDSEHDDVLSALVYGARIGTSSLRRTCQLRASRPDLDIADVRGNVDSRLRKLLAGDYAALVLAGAGLERLGFIERVADGTPIALNLNTLQNPDETPAELWAIPIPTAAMLPAVAQGALALECRADDADTLALLAALNDSATHAAALAERAFLRQLEGGCQAPIAALATVSDRRLTLTGLVSSLDGVEVVRASQTGAIDEAALLGTQLAEQLLAKGAQQILRGIRADAHENALEGKRVVLTRAEGRNLQLATRLRERGALPVVYPTIAYAPPADFGALNAALRQLMTGSYDWLVLTSATAVTTLKVWLEDHSRHKWHNVRIAAVGAATAETCVAQIHQKPALVPGTYSSAALVDAMREKFGDMSGQRVLLLNADIAQPTLQAQLEQAGAQVDRAVAYRTVAASNADDTGDVPALLTTHQVDAITFTSGSTVTYFLERICPALREMACAVLSVCIGPTTAEVARAAGFTHVVMAEAATEAALMEALATALAMNGTMPYQQVEPTQAKS